ncbi:MAG: folylpolyglutamate synthase/dihydrofolate synthase family protein [Vicinamibacterales bacterium]
MTHVERLFALEQFGIKLGLEAMRVVLAALGDPQTRWPAVHVAGTNGKGSVTAMADAVLRHAGWRVGRYTSPHLARIEERIAIDGREVAPAVLEAALARVFAVVDALVADGRLAAVPTFFEVSTAAAFVVFADAAVDVAVVEVGLGGRFDATNVIRPAVTAITSIDFDHERHLGTTLAAIAYEKAGIAKSGVPLVVGPLAPDARAVVADVAAAAGAILLPTDADVAVATSGDSGHAVLTLTTPVRTYPAFRLGLAGRHQVANAVVAVRTLEALAATAAIAVDADDVAAGLAEVRWPARLEWLRQPGRAAAVLVDAAHNPAGARALASYLQDAAIGPVTLVTSVMRDKDAAGVLGPLLPLVRRVVATHADTPRACGAAELAGRIAALDAGCAVTIVEDPWAAVQAALADGRSVVVAGSIFLAGPLREALLTRGGFQAA